jgi:hypothetical protein
MGGGGLPASIFSAFHDYFAPLRFPKNFDQSGLEARWKVRIFVENGTICSNRTSLDTKED